MWEPSSECTKFGGNAVLCFLISTWTIDIVMEFYWRQQKGLKGRRAQHLTTNILTELPSLCKAKTWRDVLICNHKPSSVTIQAQHYLGRLGIHLQIFYEIIKIHPTGSFQYKVATYSWITCTTMNNKVNTHKMSFIFTVGLDNRKP